MLNPRNNFIYIWRGILIIVSVALVGWLAWQNLVPSGIMVLEHEKGNPNSPITDLHPEKRVIDLPEDGKNQRFWVDPVYFDARAPRAFTKVKVDITWQNPSHPILELGANKTRNAFSFVLQPLQNKIIDNINWPCQRYGRVIFCQKKEKYKSLAGFFTSPPQEKILVYNYNLPPDIKYEKMNVKSDLTNYNYLIATYSPPQNLGADWYRQEVEYDWTDFQIHINELGFLISAPELNKMGGQIVVGDIRVTLQRPPLDWRGFVDYLKEQGRRFRK